MLRGSWVPCTSSGTSGPLSIQEWRKTCVPASASCFSLPDRSSLPSRGKGAGATSLSCPIRSFQTSACKGHKNWTPETQCLALFQKNFVLFTCRLILQFPQFLTFDGGWGNSFPLYQSYEIPITLSINSLRNHWAFHDSPNVIIGLFQTFTKYT